MWATAFTITADIHVICIRDNIHAIATNANDVNHAEKVSLVAILLQLLTTVHALFKKGALTVRQEERQRDFNVQYARQRSIYLPPSCLQSCCGTWRERGVYPFICIFPVINSLKLTCFIDSQSKNTLDDTFEFFRACGHTQWSQLSHNSPFLCIIALW